MRPASNHSRFEEFKSRAQPLWRAYEALRASAAPPSAGKSLRRQVYDLALSLTLTTSRILDERK